MDGDGLMGIQYGNWEWAVESLVLQFLDELEIYFPRIREKDI